MARLEWAFAGTSHTEPAVPEPGNTKPWRSVWKHWVDSKSDDPKPDEADMWPQPNGDTLEKGSTRDPDTGVVSEYEELWAELPVEKTGADEGFFSVVLQLQDDVRSAKGLIVRVGQWCEGLLKIGSDVTVERWKWVPEGSESLGQKSSTGGESKLPTVINGSHSATPERKDDQTQSEFGGNWTRIARLGARFLPCAATFDPDMARQGTVVEAGDFTWNVIESYQW